MNIILRKKAQCKLSEFWFRHTTVAKQEPTEASAIVLPALSSLLPGKPLPLPPQDLCIGQSLSLGHLFLIPTNFPSPLHADLNSNVTFLEGPFLNTSLNHLPHPVPIHHLVPYTALSSGQLPLLDIFFISY